MTAYFFQAAIYIGLATLAGFTLGCDVGKRRGRKEAADRYSRDAFLWQVFNIAHKKGDFKVIDKNTGEELNYGEE